MAGVIDSRALGGREILVISNAYNCRVLSRDSTSAPWCDEALGEFGGNCLKSVKSLIAERRLYWASGQAPAEGGMITVVPAAFQAVREWCRDAEDMTLGHTSGRKGDASASTRDAVLTCVHTSPLGRAVTLAILLILSRLPLWGREVMLWSLRDLRMIRRTSCCSAINAIAWSTALSLTGTRRRGFKRCESGALRGSQS
jgi:hypothetical protein